MILKLWAKQQLTVIILRIRKLKLEHFWAGNFEPWKYSTDTTNEYCDLVDNNQLTRSKDRSKHEETYKQEVNQDPEPPSSDSSETSSSNSRAKKKKITKKKKRRKHQKDDSSDPYSSDNSDSSDESHYRRKRRNNKKHQKKISDQTMRNFNGKIADNSI